MVQLAQQVAVQNGDVLVACFDRVLRFQLLDNRVDEIAGRHHYLGQFGETNCDFDQVGSLGNERGKDVVAVQVYECVWLRDVSERQ